MATAFQLASSKKKLAVAAKQSAQIHADEEISKRTKTIMDAEVADIQREEVLR